MSAGFDAHRDDPLANCKLTEETYAAMAAGDARALARSWTRRSGFVLEGGYDLRALAASVAATIEAARDGARRPSVEPGALVARARVALRALVAGARGSGASAPRGCRLRCDAGKKKGAVQARRPCPPLARLPSV